MSIEAEPVGTKIRSDDERMGTKKEWERVKDVDSNHKYEA